MFLFQPPIISSKTIDSTAMDDPFNALANESLLLIFSFVGLKDPRPFVSLASANRRLRRTIYRTIPSLWVDIDLSKAFQRLTDEQLASFLTNVDAKRRTETLSLKGCRISGRGLIPIAGSRTLKKINIQLDESCCAVDYRTVGNILLTLVPGTLEHVIINSKHFSSCTVQSNLPFAFSSFLIQLCLKKTQELLHAECSYCSTSLNEVVGTAGFVLSKYPGPLQSQCTGCNRHTCRSLSAGSRCRVFSRCHRCHEPKCSSCSQGLCGDCQQTSCKNCDLLLDCEQCARRSCKDCCVTIRGNRLCKICAVQSHRGPM